MSSAGVGLVFNLAADQEIFHQKLLKELFARTDLARSLNPCKAMGDPRSNTNLTEAPSISSFTRSARSRHFSSLLKSTALRKSKPVHEGRVGDWDVRMDAAALG